LPSALGALLLFFGRSQRFLLGGSTRLCSFLDKAEDTLPGQPECVTTAEWHNR